MKLNSFETITENFKTSPKMPVVFVGHGHPMNALRDNSFTQGLQNLGKSLPKPNAMLVVSAHWQTRGTVVSSNPNPDTIYDFGNFHQDLFKIRYNAKGSPEYAKLVQESIQSTKVKEDKTMGFDHGAWTVLKYIFPDANIPTFQLSLDYTKGPAYHYQLAKELYQLRSKGVLILSSGNIVHNLGALDWRNPNAKTLDWALEFDTTVKDLLLKQEHQKLINYQKLGKSALLSIPTNEHYLPMLYSIGLQDKKDKLKFAYEGFEYGAISSRCFVLS